MLKDCPKARGADLILDLNTQTTMVDYEDAGEIQSYRLCVYRSC